jgi:hypothetical protein
MKKDQAAVRAAKMEKIDKYQAARKAAKEAKCRASVAA